MNNTDYDEKKFDKDEYGNLIPREDEPKKKDEKEQKMIKFKDLVFNKHPNGFANTKAKAEFPNGYGVSIISGGGAYTSPDKPYEIAVMKNGRLCYETEITNDVLGHQTQADVEDVLEQIQNLSKG